MSGDDLLTTEEMANILRVEVTTILRWCRSKDLPAAKLGKSYRIRRADLDAWYESKRGA